MSIMETLHIHADENYIMILNNDACDEDDGNDGIVLWRTPGFTGFIAECESRDGRIEKHAIVTMGPNGGFASTFKGSENIAFVELYNAFCQLVRNLGRIGNG